MGWQREGGLVAVKQIGEAKSIDEGEKKKMRRKMEESREVGERKRKKEKIFLNERGERNLIKNIYIYIYFLALMNSAHLSIDVHCSDGAEKNRFSSTAGA